MTKQKTINCHHCGKTMLETAAVLGRVDYAFCCKIHYHNDARNGKIAMPSMSVYYDETKRRYVYVAAECSIKEYPADYSAIAKRKNILSSNAPLETKQHHCRHCGKTIAKWGDDLYRYAGENIFCRLRCLDDYFGDIQSNEKMKAAYLLGKYRGEYTGICEGVFWKNNKKPAQISYHETKS